MKKIDFNENWLFRIQNSDWKKITLPHDAQLLDGRRSDAPGGSGHGFFDGNMYFYEKHFQAPKEWEGKTIQVLFEGIYRNAVVSLNGCRLTEHRYGYTPFIVDIGNELCYGGENVLSVKADNTKLPNSRWYTGGGIYRPVSLLIGEKEHIKWQGVKIRTISSSPAVIHVTTETTGKPAHIEILEGDRLAAQGIGNDLTFKIEQARLWSEKEPNLYTCRATVGEGKETDCVEEKFGIRELSWNPHGFFVNGEETLLRGGCIHHDNGIVGAASFPESEWRRIRILKEQGFNAIRVAHNPASTAMLEACDYYGMYVMDETFDMWYVRKTKYDYGLDFRTCWKQDVEAMVERDYNHPSVIMYSIGNEVSEPGKPEGVEQGKEMIQLIKKMDDTRAVTGGMNLMIMTNFAKGKGQYDNVDAVQKQDAGEEKKEAKNASLLFNTIAAFVGPGMNKAGNSKKADQVSSPILDAMDIAGYNYANGRYPIDGKAHPGRIIVGSETFPYEIGKNWDMVKKYPYLIGDFMWTAWDYLGEVGLGAWSYTGKMSFRRTYPWILSGAGVIDILGNPDASLGLAQTVWRITKNPVIGVRPVNHRGVKVSKSVWRRTNAVRSWSWEKCEGNPAEIEVFADATEVELFLNHVSLGRKKLKDYQAKFRTKYAPGILEAIAYDAAGKELSRSRLESAEGEKKVKIIPEKNILQPGEVAYFNVEIQGENGIVEFNADRKLSVSVNGGELLGFGSANPCTEENYVDGAFTTYYGRAQAIVRAGNLGAVTVTVRDEEQEICSNVEIK